MKTRKLLAAFALILVVLITGCKKDTYLATVGVCPLVVSTIPANGAIGIPLNQVVSATFNEAMNPTTINASSLTLTATMNIAGVKAALVPIAGAVTYSGMTATFTPSTPLAANTTYTGRVTTAAKDMMGNAIQEDYVWTFNTGVAPTVNSTDPLYNATGVLLNKVVTATFSIPMDPVTLSSPSTTFNVKLGTTAIAGTVAYTGTTVSFTPTAALISNSVYTATITSAAKSLAGIAMASNYVWSFNTGISPTVISTDPANIATGVFLNKIVTAVFSMPMDPLTMVAANVTLKQGTNVIAGAITYSGTTLTFTPTSALAPNTVYTGTITAGAKNLAGIPMAADYVWNFNTGTSPIVISTDPINLATGVVLNKVVAATFSVPMDYLSLTTTTFTLKQGVNVIAGAVTYSGTTASFTPTSILSPGLVYTGTITTGTKSLAGIPLAADYVWTFTTGLSPTVISTDPINLATGVVLNKIVSATFSVPMDYLTITGTTFTLKQGANVIAGAVTYNGTVASFTPTSDLSPGLVYTGTITTGAKSLLGVPLGANYVWTFSTGGSPTVTSTSPANLATAVALNKIVTANFSMAMDPLTINGINFTLTQGANVLTGTVSYNGTTASFTPSNVLVAGLVYTGTITTGAKSLAGIPLAANYVWTFTTIPAAAPNIILTDPIDKSTGVALNKTIGATFDMPMDRTTLVSPATTFTLMQGTTVIAGTVTYSSANAYFKPSVDLLFGTTYTAKITTGAKNVAGTPIAKDSVWTFTTLPEVKPLFSSIFGSFGGNAGITNQGIYTVINNGSIGTTAASTLITGFHDSTGDVYTETPLNIGNVTGRIYTDAPPPVIFAAGGPYGGNASTMAIAQAGLQAASDFYISISPANKPGGTTLSTSELGGRTLAPGIYVSGSSYDITTLDLTLDAQGDPNAEWIFQVPTALTVGTPSGARSVILTGGAQAKNVYWYVGTSAVINYAGGGTMVGTIIANSGVTLSSPGNSTNTTVQTVLNGRAISLVSSVTMVNTIINVPQ